MKATLFITGLKIAFSAGSAAASKDSAPPPRTQRLCGYYPCALELQRRVAEHAEKISRRAPIGHDKRNSLHHKNIAKQFNSRTQS